VDLTEKALRIVVNGGEDSGEISPGNRDGGETEGIIPSTRVSAFVRRYGGAAGINTTPFYPASGRQGEDRTIVGITVADGIPVALPAPPYDALVFYRDKRAAILSQAEIDRTLIGESIVNAVGGFFRVLEAGEVPEGILRERNTARHPRSAAGLSAGGTVLYLLVIDGRRTGSIGATEGETGIILKRLGATEGLNFDGGGSSALALRFPDGKVRVVNTPVHGGIPGWERGVASCLGIAPLVPGL
jgi:exopolysaccharide biosynthesis protein